MRARIRCGLINRSWLASKELRAQRGDENVDQGTIL